MGQKLKFAVRLLVSVLLLAILIYIAGPAQIYNELINSRIDYNFAGFLLILLGTFIADIVLQILSFVAENERANIRHRQAEGIAAAKARGVRFGRPPKKLPSNFYVVYQTWKDGKITCTKAAEECGMPLSTFRYRARDYQRNKKS